MVRGLSFQVYAEDVDDILYKILESIPAEKYHWFNDLKQTEGWYCTARGDAEPFLNRMYYTGKELLTEFRKRYMVIFLKLSAYLDEDYKEIHTYEEFYESKCEFIILAYDCNFFEIYSKNHCIIQNIYDSVRTIKSSNIQYILDTNDERKVLDVL